MRRVLAPTLLLCSVFLVGWAFLVDNFLGVPMTVGTPTNGQGWVYSSATGKYALTALGAGKFKLYLSPGNAELTGATSNPTLTGVAGTNANYSILSFNDSTLMSARYVVGGVITKDYSSANSITVRVWWRAAAITNAVVWRVRVVSVDDGTVIDTAYDTTTPHTVTDTAKGTTLQLNQADITWTPSATELTAGRVWLIEIARDATSGSDTMTNDADFVGADVWEN